MLLQTDEDPGACIGLDHVPSFRLARLGGRQPRVVVARVDLQRQLVVGVEQLDQHARVPDLGVATQPVGGVSCDHFSKRLRSSLDRGVKLSAPSNSTRRWLRVVLDLSTDQGRRSLVEVR